MDAKLRFAGTRRRAVAVTAGLSSRVQSIGFRLRRRRISRQYLRGDGLEIGALHRPLRVPASVNVRYVDRMDVADLRAHYPELRKAQLVDVDIIDDGETLSSQADASADFIIANHFIEHTEDPIGTVANHLRVLRPGGVLYLAVPDRHHTFDVDRPPTPVDHIVRDHRDGPAWLDAETPERERSERLDRVSHMILFPSRDALRGEDHVMRVRRCIERRSDRAGAVGEYAAIRDDYASAA